MRGESEASISVVVPAYNEAPVIASVIAKLIKLKYNVIIVDDGSTDRTGEFAALAGASVLTHPVNLGQGAALQTGIEFAMRQDAEYIVTFDADGQHQATDIARLVEALQRHDADFALGSRFLGASVGIPSSRRMLLKAAIWFTRMTTGLRIPPPPTYPQRRTLRELKLLKYFSEQNVSENIITILDIVKPTSYENFKEGE